MMPESDWERFRQLRCRWEGWKWRFKSFNEPMLFTLIKNSGYSTQTATLICEQMPTRKSDINLRKTTWLCKKRR
jgi:hypothetical protein